MTRAAAVIAYCVLQSIAFVVIVAGAPIDQFRSSSTRVLDNTRCLTFWGMKPKCYGNQYDVLTNTLWALCDERRALFHAAEVFSIASVILFLAAAIFGFFQLCGCQCLRWLCLVLNILGAFTVGFCWAAMVSEYYTSRGVCLRLNIGFRFGAGFALFVTGWVLCLINIVILVLPR